MAGFRIPVPQMNDNIVVKGDYVYLNAGLQRYYAYNLREPIMGKGGMGEVYRGYDCRTGEPVAIKRLYDRYCNIPSFRQKARKESQLTFSHQNIVEMLGICEFRNGRGPIFIISAFVPGLNVDKFIERQSMVFSGSDRAEKIIRLLTPLLDALHFLHRQKIYHLDIKPSNIMIDRFSTARLMDLGIANTTMETAGFGRNEIGVLGTPRFAAPEQFRIPGEISEVDQTSDLYEFAVTLYELITGENPYEGGTSIEDTARKHFTGYLCYHPTLTGPIHKVLQRAGDPDKKARYQSAQEMKAALVEALKPQKPKRRWPFGF